MNPVSSQIFSYSFRSKLIRNLKILMAFAAFLIVLLVIIWPIANPVKKALVFNYSNIKKNDSDKAIMLNPSFNGIDANNQPFKVTAKEAEQISNDNIRLKGIEGDIFTRNESWFFIEALTGNFLLSSKTLLLQDEVNVFSDAGYEFSTSKVNVDLNSGIAYGNESVVLHGMPGILNATGFEILDNGKKFIFHGRVNMIIEAKE